MKVISKILSMAFVVSVSAGSVASESKKFVTVTLPKDISQALKIMETLKEYDVAGIDWNSFQASLLVTPAEMTQIQNQNVKVVLDFEKESFADNIDKYTDADEVAQFIKNAHEKYPNLTEVIEVGKTTQGRAILGLSISQNRAKSPTVLFNGMLHARELMTTEVNLDIIDTLLKGYSSNKEVTSWINNLNIVIVPQVNPDGNNLVYTTKRLWRKNAYTVKDKLTGVDLNRNYPATWNRCNGSSGSSNSDTYRGPTAGSEPETKAMMALVRRLKPIMNISYHSFSELIIYPYGCKIDPNPSEKLFKDIGEDMNRRKVSMI